MKTICPNCRRRIKFSLLRIDAMRLQCPTCHAFVFEGFKVLEIASVLGALGILGLAIFFDIVSGYKILILVLLLAAFVYAVRLLYVLFQKHINEQ